MLYASDSYDNATFGHVKSKVLLMLKVFSMYIISTCNGQKL
jgi:hypothetical protein